jgi:hypothetical protein
MSGHGQETEVGGKVKEQRIAFGSHGRCRDWVASRTSRGCGARRDPVMVLVRSRFWGTRRAVQRPTLVRTDSCPRLPSPSPPMPPLARHSSHTSVLSARSTGSASSAPDADLMDALPARRRPTPDQLDALETRFGAHQYLGRQERIDLALAIGMCVARPVSRAPAAHASAATGSSAR